MGCNFYFHEKPPCQCCGHEFEPRHIGKSSGGWCFSLHVYPDDRIETLDDWKALFTTKGSIIKDEYGTTLTPAEMVDRIINRSWRERDDSALSRLGYKSWQNYLAHNHAIEGPNNLLRHRLEQPEGGNERKPFTNGCVGHGEGIWDYIVGEFS